MEFETDAAAPTGASPASLASLPPELLPAVLRPLGRRDLARCAATCRALYSAAMALLLRSLRPVRRDFPLFERVLEKTHLAEMVRELSLDGGLGQKDMSWCLRAFRKVRRLRVELARDRAPAPDVLQGLEDLEDLELRFSDHVGNAFLAAVDFPPFLRKLAIRMVRWINHEPPAEVLARIEEMCPRLEALSLALFPDGGSSFLERMAREHPGLVGKLGVLEVPPSAIPRALASHTLFAPAELVLHFPRAARGQAPSSVAPAWLWDAVTRLRFRRLALHGFPTASLLRGVPRTDLLVLAGDFVPCIPASDLPRVVAGIESAVGKVAVGPSVLDSDHGGERAAWRRLAALPPRTAPRAIKLVKRDRRPPQAAPPAPSRTRISREDSGNATAGPGLGRAPRKIWKGRDE